MTLYDIKVKAINGEDVQLDTYKDKVLLIVNTATHCGFTPQYTGLQKLYETYKDEGLVILDFPCNQFLNQAPEDDEAIQSFCTLNYKTTFPQFAKIEVNGDEESPLYTFLKAKQPGALGKGIKWNFTKFLVDRKGNVVKRYGPNKKPEQIEADIKKVLATNNG